MSLSLSLSLSLSFSLSFFLSLFLSLSLLFSQVDGDLTAKLDLSKFRFSFMDAPYIYYPPESEGTIMSRQNKLITNKSFLLLYQFDQFIEECLCAWTASACDKNYLYIVYSTNNIVTSKIHLHINYMKCTEWNFYMYHTCI